MAFRRGLLSYKSMSSRRQFAWTPWPEAISAALVAALAASLIAVWLAAWPGLPVMPALGLMAALAGGAATLVALRPFGGSGWVLVAWLALVAGIGAWLLTFAAPGWLPPGNLGDLTHHLLLIDVLDRTRQLVPNTAEAEAAFGEMAHYTPGFHLLAVLVGSWTGAGALAVVYPLIVAMVALKFGLVALVARVVTGTGTVTSNLQQNLLPVLAVGFVLSAPIPFTVGSFVRDGFLAQVAAELFAVAGWWSIAAWSERPRPALLALSGVYAAAAFLTWPIWIGPLILVGVAIILTAPAVTTRDRARGFALLTVPTLIVASMHVSRHWRALGIAGTHGWVPAFEPTWATWIALALAALGLVFTSSSIRVRPATWFLAAIAAQAATLYAAARMNDADTPYMAIKMIYLAVYPVAVLATVAVDRALRAWPHKPTLATAAAATAVALMAASNVASMPAPPLMVSVDMVRGGQWARESLPLSCVDYIVRDAETAYWLHLAVLGQPRSSPRTAAIDGYRANLTIGNWIARGGLPYAIADARLLPPEVRETTTVLHRVGQVVIIERNDRGDTAACKGQ
jgi:hypothetical protein